MKALEKIKASKELAALVVSLKSGVMGSLEKVKASKRVGELVELLGGSISENAPEIEGDGLRKEAIQLVSAWVEKKGLGWSDQAIMDFVDKSFGRFAAAENGTLADYIAIRELLNNGMNPTSQKLFTLYTRGQVVLSGLSQKDGKIKLDAWSKYTTDDVDRYYMLKDSHREKEQLDNNLRSDWEGISPTWQAGIIDRLENAGFEIIAKKNGVAISYIFGNGEQHLRNIRKSSDMRFFNSFMREAFKRFGTLRGALEYLKVLEPKASETQQGDVAQEQSATVTVASNPLYQSVIDGAEISRELIEQLISEGEKDPTNEQFLQAVAIVVDKVKAMQ